MDGRYAFGLIQAAIGMVVIPAPGIPGAIARAEPVIDQQTAQTGHNRQIVEAAFERWEAGESGFFNEVLSTDVIWTIEGSSPSAGTFRGRDDFIERAVRPFVIRLSTPVRPVAQRVWADGDHVIVNFDGEGMACDGVMYRNSYVWIMRMRDGQAVEVTAFLDLAPYDDVLRRVPASAVEARSK